MSPRSQRHLKRSLRSTLFIAENAASRGMALLEPPVVRSNICFMGDSEGVWIGDLENTFAINRGLLRSQFKHKTRWSGLVIFMSELIKINRGKLT